jgi:hypothetical protein
MSEAAKSLSREHAALRAQECADRVLDWENIVRQRERIRDLSGNTDEQRRIGEGFVQVAIRQVKNHQDMLDAYQRIARGEPAFPEGT